jgi:hypothetical protein
MRKAACVRVRHEGKWLLSSYSRLCFCSDGFDKKKQGYVLASANVERNMCLHLIAYSLFNYHDTKYSAASTVTSNPI